MGIRTFREVCEEIGVSRTTAQGWVVGILHKPQNKEKDNTPWYFDEEEYENMWLIRFYKQLGYKNKDIEEIINNPNFNRQYCLENQIIELTKQKKQIENSISAAYWIKETGISPKSLKDNISELKDIKYEDIMSVIISASSILNLSAGKDYLADEYFVEEEIDQRFTVFEKIMDFYDMGKDTSSPKVQEQLALLPEATIFPWCFLPEGRLAQEINTDYGTGKAEYFGSITNFM